MRILGVTETCDLGALYMRLQREGHEVRVAISEPLARGTMAGIVPQVADWRDELGWIRAAGDRGMLLFESVSSAFGNLQDELRAQGLAVIGGSAFGDRLENDRGHAQALLAAKGFASAVTCSFTSAEEAIAYIAGRPRRYVLKFCGPGFASGDNFVGDRADGADVAALLTARADQIDGDEFILMDFIAGIEVGVGAYFNGRSFLGPACLDWEHKRFFAGDMGELTGEMGTVATFAGTEAFFERTLRRFEPEFAAHGHVGYVNLNTIVNGQGIWPLEFTCRFGYPGFAVLGALQRTGWGDLFAAMLSGGTRFSAHGGYAAAVVVTTPPFPYSRKQVAEPVGLPITFDDDLPAAGLDAFYLGEVGRSHGGFVTAGLYGWTMVVTGRGRTVAASRARAYRAVRAVTVPNGRYRLDIGARVAGQIERLRAMGVISPDPAAGG